jgi:hypothetical protein
MTSGIIALIVGASQPDTGFASGFPADDAKRRSVGGMTGIENGAAWYTQVAQIVHLRE